MASSRVYKEQPKSGNAKKAWLMFVEKWGVAPAEMTFTSSYFADEKCRGGAKGWILELNVSVEARQMNYGGASCNDFYEAETVNDWVPFDLDDEQVEAFQRAADLINTGDMTAASEWIEYNNLSYRNVSRLDKKVKNSLDVFEKHRGGRYPMFYGRCTKPTIGPYK